MKTREELQKDFQETVFKVGAMKVQIADSESEIDRLLMQAANIKIDFARLSKADNVMPIKTEEKTDNVMPIKTEEKKDVEESK